MAVRIRGFTGLLWIPVGNLQPDKNTIESFEEKVLLKCEVLARLKPDHSQLQPSYGLAKLHRPKTIQSDEGYDDDNV